ncbi:eclosion hormone-like [Uranotaenia lowii]|uniref:eclosion hormone-like n=1 Tax=Uranotaenia lowii TaxID=190385 RepID=UPI00247A7066|nr:eclosion hormone-like [Uranotaenia lowii]
MHPSKINALVVAAVFCIIVSIGDVNCGPAMDIFGGYEMASICMTNCAQCKRMYGTFFDGQVCAESCLEFKGKIIPDCEDLGSIAAFLNHAEMKKYA